MRNAGLDEAQAGIKIARRNINNLRYADDTTLMAESEELKSLLMKVKEWKSWLKTQHSEKLDHGIWSHHFMANRWENNGNSERILGGSKITADGDCSHEIKRRLFLGRKAMTSLDSIWKSRDITLPTKVHLLKAMVFPVVMYGCESWAIKESWAPKNWCFWTVVLEKTLESPLDCKIKPFNPKENQSWIFTGRTDAETETPILWPPGGKNWLIWKDPDAGKDWRRETGKGDDRGWDGWMASPTQWTQVWVSS